jgi:hypothetical protein
VRRWWHALDWRWQRTKLAAKDNDPDRIPKLARLRLLWEGLRPRQALLFADELDHYCPANAFDPPVNDSTAGGCRRNRLAAI